MFGKRKAEDNSEESGNKQSKIDKKDRTEDIKVKEEENGETESPVTSTNNDNENGSQDGFASAGTCDRKDDRDVASSTQLYAFMHCASCSTSLKEVYSWILFFINQVAGF
jgi:hypothetical protein